MYKLVDVPLLCDGQQSVGDPIQNQTRWEERKKYREHDWHDLHDLGLHRISWRRIQFLLTQHGRAHYHGKDKIRVAR